MEQMLWMGEQAVTVGRVAKPDRLLAHIAKVTPRDIKRVARQLFMTERMHLVVVGPIPEPQAARLTALCRIG